MNKIVVIGGNGSGKTTFAKILGNQLNIPVTHMDKICRTDNWQRANEDVIRKTLTSIMSAPKWIIDGNDTKTLPLRLKKCDTVFYFDFNTITCFYGVLKRTFANYGKHRDDVGGENNIEKFDMAKITFLKEIINFNRKNRKRYYEMISENSDIKRIVFKSRKQVNAYLNHIMQ